MKSFLRSINAFFIILLLLYSALLSVYKFKLSNPEFYIEALKKPGVYNQIERGIKKGIKTYVESQIESRGIVIEKLTVSERSLLSKSIEELSGIFTQERIRELFENNIRNFFSYTNGKTERLILYLPLNEWGLPPNFSLSKPLNLISSETDVLNLLSQSRIGEGVQNTEKFLTDLQNINYRLERQWKLASFALIGLLIVYFATEPSKFKMSPPGKLFLFSGILMFLMGASAIFLTKSMTESILYIDNPFQIVFSAIVPPVLTGILNFWFSMAAFIILAGIIGLIIDTYKLNKLKRKQNIFTPKRY